MLRTIKIKTDFNEETAETACPYTKIAVCRPLTLTQTVCRWFGHQNVIEYGSVIMSSNADNRSKV